MSSGKRSWGRVEELARGDNYLIKIISIAPGKELKTRSHDFRSETWHILSGTGTVEIDNRTYHANYGKQFNIQAMVRHSLKNTGPTEVILLEVQFGSWLSEEDVILYN